MTTPIDIDGRLQRNLIWQTQSVPGCQLAKVMTIIKDGGVLRRCPECGCAMLQHSQARIAGDETVERCASCGNLEAV